MHSLYFLWGNVIWRSSSSNSIYPRGFCKSVQMNPFKFFMNNNNLIKLTYYCRSHAFNQIHCTHTHTYTERQNGQWHCAQRERRLDVAVKLHEMHHCQSIQIEINFVSCRWAETITWNVIMCRCTSQYRVCIFILYIFWSSLISFLLRFFFSSAACSVQICVAASQRYRHTHTHIIRDNKHWSIQSAFEDGLFKIFSENVKWETKKSFSENENNTKKGGYSRIQNRVYDSHIKRYGRKSKKSEWERYLLVYRPLTFIWKMNAWAWLFSFVTSIRLGIVVRFANVDFIIV